MPLPQKTPLALVMTGGALALAGCGGSGSGSTVSPTAYVKSVCQAVGPFEQDITSRSQRLNLANIKSAAAGKHELVLFLQAASQDSSRVVARLKSAGSPQLQNGTKISATIVRVFAQLDTALSKAARQSENLPTSSAASFRTAAASLGAGVQGSMAHIGQGLSGLRSPELQKAAAKVPACGSIGG
jgi:hypothetical protein